MVRMIENHCSFPSIVQWVVFNEGWGQYEVSYLSDLVVSMPWRLSLHRCGHFTVCGCDPTLQTERLTDLAKRTDPSRLVCCASGWHDKPVGDIIDMHIYVGPGQHPVITLVT